LTESAAKAIGVQIHESDRLGGPEHRYWKQRIAEHLRSLGYEVTVEAPLGGGKTVDLLAMRNGRRIAIEIETGKSDVAANVGKCLEAGMNPIFVVATTLRARGELLRVVGIQDDVRIIAAHDLLAGFAGSAFHSRATRNHRNDHV
jgi:hypothetical protein